jgi:exo-beta-1,3-glucanase (GH17 family)
MTCDAIIAEGVWGMKRILIALSSLLFAVMAMGQDTAQTHPAVPGKIDLTQQQWNGNAICYSGYRGAETPEKELFPTQAEVLQDLRILEKNWHLIRVYGADQHSADILEVIQREKLGIKVMLGVWLSGRPDAEAKNQQQVATGIRLANQYPGIVAAVSVGNEALVSWSDHKMTEQQMIDRVQFARKAVHCPVTVADDYLYWSRADAKLVDYVDFITMHTYPVWGKEDIGTGLSSTIRNYQAVRGAHPGKTIVLGEVGWPTYTVGEMHAPQAGDEKKQNRYYQEIVAWSRAHNVTTFFFEAFDEPWKGAGTEGHWGLFSERRKAKLAMQELYPELKPSGPTSPSYSVPASTQEAK